MDRESCNAGRQGSSVVGRAAEVRRRDKKFRKAEKHGGKQLGEETGRRAGRLTGGEENEEVGSEAGREAGKNAGRKAGEAWQGCVIFACVCGAAVITGGPAAHRQDRAADGRAPGNWVA